MFQVHGALRSKKREQGFSIWNSFLLCFSQKWVLEELALLKYNQYCITSCPPDEGFCFSSLSRSDGKATAQLVCRPWKRQDGHLNATGDEFCSPWASTLKRKTLIFRTMITSPVDLQRQGVCFKVPGHYQQCVTVFYVYSRKCIITETPLQHLIQIL